MIWAVIVVAISGAIFLQIVIRLWPHPRKTHTSKMINTTKRFHRPTHWPVPIRIDDDSRELALVRKVPDFVVGPVDSHRGISALTSEKYKC